MKRFGIRYYPDGSESFHIYYIFIYDDTMNDYITILQWYFEEIYFYLEYLSKEELKKIDPDSIKTVIMYEQVRFTRS